MANKAKYAGIVEKLAERIVRGEFMTGERFLSRSELCRLYDISGLTAVKIQNCLADRGLLKKVHGNGVYINYSKEAGKPAVKISSDEKIKRIIEFRAYGYNGKGFSVPILSAAESTAAESGINYNISLFRPSEVSLNDINLLDIDQEAGYLVICDGEYPIIHAAVILLNPRIHSVLVDTFIPGSHCVYTDSFDGMRQIVDYAVETGCRRFIFCQKSLSQCAELYNADRRDAALYHAGRHGFKCTTTDMDHFSDILEMLSSSEEKTIVMFPHDDLALRFKKILAGRKMKRIPLVTGFDDYAEVESGLEHLTTLRVNRERLGQEAVKILLEPNTACKKIVRVPGELIIRN